MQDGPFIEKSKQLLYALLALPAAIICYVLVILLLLYAPHAEYVYDLAIKDLSQFSLVVPNIIALYALFVSMLFAQITKPFGKAFAWRGCSVRAGVGWVALMVCLVGIDLVLQKHLNLRLDSPWYRLLLQHQASWFWYGLLLLVVPCLEECLFRGFIYYGIARSVFGHSGAIALTAYLWAMPAGYHHPYWLLVNMVYGIVLGCARYKSHSIVPPICMHIVCGLVLFLNSPVVPAGWW
jgi:membrane protease YdiL (CAAX protease family)